MAKATELQDRTAFHIGNTAILETVAKTLANLRFGAIQLTVHEGRLVQVDVTERHRYPN